MAGDFNIRLIADEELSDWNDSLLVKEDSTLQQSVNWAAFLSRYYGAKTYFIRVTDRWGKTAACLSLYRIGRYPEIYYKKPLTNLIKSAVNGFNQCLSWTEGPVFFSEENEERILSDLLGFVEDIAAKENVRIIRDLTLPVMIRKRGALEDIFAGMGYSKNVWATYMVDLGRTEDDIWNSFKGKITRTPVRKAQSMGLCFKECAKDDIADYFSCEREHGRLKGLSVQPKKRFDILWETLSPIGGYRIFSAMYKERPIAFMPLRCFNKTVHIVKPVQSKEAFYGKIPAGDFLVWECLKWAKGRGFRHFDLAGVSCSPKTKEEEGIRFFKEKWGGDYYEYGVFSKKI